MNIFVFQFTLTYKLDKDNKTVKEKKLFQSSKAFHNWLNKWNKNKYYDYYLDKEDIDFNDPFKDEIVYLECGDFFGFLN